MSTIFITGSSSGIGRATAKLFAERGWRVVATMRQPDCEQELAQHDNVVLYPLDVTKPGQVRETCQRVLATEDVDVLFNNVGAGMKGRFEDISEERIRASFETNLLGMVRVTQQFIPHFKQRGGGLILTTTSLAGVIGLPLDGFYAACKWGEQGLCEMLYYELRPFNVLVKTLVPGVVKTNFKMDASECLGCEDVQAREVELLMPNPDDLETAEEAAEDVWRAVTDGDRDRMVYVTGERARELYKRRQQLGDEAFRCELREIFAPGR